MRQSSLFTKQSHHAPADEVSRNAQLLIRAGFIDKLMAGVYSFLPLGLRVLKKIEAIIREEMVALGGREILMPALHPIENYVKTGREAIDPLFHVESATGKKLVLGQSHEEVVVPLLKHHISSYKDLPLSVFQIQTKFRNELRAKSGIFRGLEFLMKDMYSFHADEKDFEDYYEQAQAGYKNVFDRAGIGESTVLTYASGGTFSKYSHEFQTRTDAGEDTIYLCGKCGVAINDEIINELEHACPKCSSKDLEEMRAIEVGNIFPLKTRFADAFGLTFQDATSAKQPILMGCYGIGLSRLMGTIAELNSDDKGLAWPDGAAPFRVHLVRIGESDAVTQQADALYADLEKRGVEVLYDDREDKSAGEKFAEADLIGIPWRAVVSEKTIQQNGIEIKKRTESEARIVNTEELLGMVETATSA